jgi:hypothetical protein
MHWAGWHVSHFAKVRVQRRDGSTYWVTPGKYDSNGWLDLCAVRERTIFAEIKKKNGVLTPDERIWLGRHKTAGNEAYVWFPKDWEAIKEIVITRRRSARIDP